MTITKRFWYLSTVLIVVLAVLGVIAILQLVGASHSAMAATAEYEAMDHAVAARATVDWLRTAVAAEDGLQYLNLRFLRPIDDHVTKMDVLLTKAIQSNAGDSTAESRLLTSCRDRMADLSSTLSAATNGSTRQTVLADLDSLSQALTSLDGLLPSAARRHILDTHSQLVSLLGWSVLWLFIALASSAVVHYRQFRTMVIPLLKLRDRMAVSAKNSYKEDIIAAGDREFHELAGMFNGLARQLSDLYQNMESKIVTRSRELVRSERLASVGFLAAGVAHEINNPLSVISGYAELASRSLRRVLLGPDKQDHSASDAEAEALALSQAMEAQDIIREESFRCKDITHRLLSLARDGGKARTPLALDELARQVVVLTRGLRNYSQRNVTLDFEDGRPLMVVANATEMKQVFLNLTVNALEASEHGEVRVGGRQLGDMVELYVADSGKGMPPDMIERIFEPFYTDKRGVTEPGTGLGLSITHAIVENHGGAIMAASAGPGRGSRFTVRLPACKSLHVDSRDVQVPAAGSMAKVNGAHDR